MRSRSIWLFSTGSSAAWSFRRAGRSPNPPPGSPCRPTTSGRSAKDRPRGNVVEEEYALTIPTGTVPVEEFDAFAATARKVDDAFLSGIRVKTSK